MEIDIDGVPWRDEIVNVPTAIDKGDYILPKGPGWGVEVDEESCGRTRRSSEVECRASQVSALCGEPPNDRPAFSG